jgi:prolyl-tRNA editing enzyme YbaK/EbsC (Cys-tRNA(Pro) deacylase)
MEGIEEAVIGHLEQLGADYRIMPCEPALADTAAFCEHYGVAPDISANAILVASRRPPDRHALCLALATTRLDVNRKVRSLLGVRKLSFASAELTIELTGMAIGGVTPFGLPGGVPVYVDAAITRLDRCVVGGGSRAMKIEVDPEVFSRMEGVEVVEALAVGPDSERQDPAAS